MTDGPDYTAIYLETYGTLPPPRHRETTTMPTAPVQPWSRADYATALARTDLYLTDLYEAAARLIGCTADDLTGRSRLRVHVRGRWVVMYVLREQGLSLPGIASVMDRHHTTVIHGLEAIVNDRALHDYADVLAYRLHQYGPQGLAPTRSLG